jgi:hypothetical protein
LTLVIAFGEFRLMQKNQILWCEKIKYLTFEYNEGSPNEIPTITIKSTSFPCLHIGYGRPKGNHSKENTDYLIFSKLDWNILKKHIQPIQTVKFQNKTLINIKSLNK